MRKKTITCVGRRFHGLGDDCMSFGDDYVRQEMTTCLEDDCVR